MSFTQRWILLVRVNLRISGNNTVTVEIEVREDRDGECLERVKCVHRVSLEPGEPLGVGMYTCLIISCCH